MKRSGPSICAPEVLVACNVLSARRQNKPNVFSADCTRRKPVTVNASDFVCFGVLVRVKHEIDSRARNLVSWFEKSGFFGMGHGTPMAAEQEPGWVR